MAAAAGALHKTQGFRGRREKGLPVSVGREQLRGGVSGAGGRRGFQSPWAWEQLRGGLPGEPGARGGPGLDPGSQPGVPR